MTNLKIVEAIEKMIITKPNKGKDIIDLINYIFKERLTEKELKKFNEDLGKVEVNEMLITVRERLALNDKKILEQGIAQGIALIVKNMKNSGMKNVDIQRLTGLSKKEVETIIKKEE